MAERVPQSTAFDVVFKAYLASDHVSAATGKTIAITISKNKAAFGNPSAGATNATEIASGWYYVNLSTTDTGTLGPLILRGAEGTIDDVGIAYMVIGNPKVDVDTIKTQAVTCAAGVTIRADVGAAGAPGAANGILTTDGTSMNQLLKQGTHTSVVIPTVTTVGTLTTYTGNTPQTGDAYAIINGASGCVATKSQLQDIHDSHLPAALVGGRMDSSVGAMAANVLTATAINADAITAAKIANAAIDIATFAADCLTGGVLKANVESVTAGAITAAAIADNAIDIATFAADVKTGSYLNAQVKGQDNIDFGALQKTSLNAATPASVQNISAQTGDSFARLGVAGAGLTAIGDTRMANLDAAITSRLAPAGTLATVTNLTNAPTAGDLTATMKTSVNAEVVDALATDTYAEPAQGAPGATISLKDKIGYLFKAWRNRTTQTASQYSLYNDDAATVDHKASFSDNSTTADRGEVATGP